MMLTQKSLASQCHFHFADRVVPGWRLEWGTKIYLIKRKKHDFCQGWGGGGGRGGQLKPGHLIRPG